MAAIICLPTGLRAQSVGISGTVVLPTGQPAAGAQVGLDVSDYSLWLGHANLNKRSGRSQVIATDHEGRYSFPPTAGQDAVVAVNESGYGWVEAKDFTNGLKIMLQPWGTVEGVLRIGNRLGTNESVHLTVFTRPGTLECDYRAFDGTTDRDGKFVFTDVPPGECSVFHSGLGDRFTVKSGETNHITVGGTGRAVVGKIRLPATVTNDSNSFGWVSLDGTGHHLAERMIRDGSFRINDVPAGTWSLEAEVTRNKTGGGVQLVCATGQTIVIPNMPGGRSGEPLDLGTLEPLLVHAPKVGDLIPPFEVKTSDGNVFKLADHRGQYVLLDFEGYLAAR